MAKAAVMAVRLGLGPIGWSNDDLPELGVCWALRAIGHDVVLSIEPADFAVAPIEGVKQSVALVRDAIAAG